MLRTVIALLLLCIAPAASTAQPAAPKKPDSRKTVGVISAIGHKFALQKIGITVFGNELKEVPIASWGIDDSVVSKVSALLSKHFNVKKINYPKGAFTSYETPGGLFRDADAELQGIIRQISASQKSDFYIVVTRGGSQFSNTNQFLAGLGMLEFGGTLNPDNVYLFTLAVVDVYDGRTFALVQRQRASVEQFTLFSAIHGSHRKLDRTWWPASPEAVHNEKLKTATRALVEQSLAMTVPEVMKEHMGTKGRPRAKEAETWSPFKQ